MDIQEVRKTSEILQKVNNALDLIEELVKYSAERKDLVPSYKQLSKLLKDPINVTDVMQFFVDLQDDFNRQIKARDDAELLIRSQQQSIDKLKTSITSKQEMTQLERQLKNTQDELQRSILQFVERGNELTIACVEKDKAIEQLLLVRKENDSLHIQITDMGELLAETRKSISNSLNTVSDRDVRIRELEKTNGTLQQEIDIVQEHREDLLDKVKNRDRKLDKLEKEIKALQQEVNNIRTISCI